MLRTEHRAVSLSAQNKRRHAEPPSGGNRPNGGGERGRSLDDDRLGRSQASLHVHADVDGLPARDVNPHARRGRQGHIAVKAQHPARAGRRPGLVGRKVKPALRLQVHLGTDRIRERDARRADRQLPGTADIALRPLSCLSHRRAFETVNSHARLGHLHVGVADDGKCAVRPVHRLARLVPPRPACRPHPVRLAHVGEARTRGHHRPRAADQSRHEAPNAAAPARGPPVSVPFHVPTAPFNSHCSFLHVSLAMKTLFRRL